MAGANDNEKVTPSDKHATGFVRMRRLGGYAFWHSAGFMLPLGIDRLLICPLLSPKLGAELFGSFLWVVGVMYLLGNVGANGFAFLLMRDMASEPMERGRSMLRTALLLSGGLSCLILALGSVASLAVAEPLIKVHAVALFVPLGIHALLRSFQLLVLANLRVQQQFKALFLLKLLEGLTLLGVFLFSSGLSLWLVGSVYVASMMISIPVGIVGRTELTHRAEWWNGDIARWLMRGWYAGALLAVAEQAQLYASRLIVGIAAGTADVAVFYAGMSIGNLFVFPAGQLGKLVLSLLSGQSQFVLGGSKGRTYVAAVLGLALAVGAASYLLGGWLVRTLYPDLAPETMKFYHWIALANGCTCVRVLMRPVAEKYGALSRVVLLSVIAVLVQLGALVVLVPMAQARGAAIAVALSSALAGALWLVFYAQLRNRADKTSTKTDFTN